MKIFYISNKTFIDAKPFHIRFDQVDGFIRICDEITYLTFLAQKNMKLFTTELDILQDKKVASHIFFLTILQKKINLNLNLNFLNFSLLKTVFFTFFVWHIYNG